MTTISLYHRGLGLWVDRTKSSGYWEVLFPRAQRAPGDDGNSLPPHYPVLKIPDFSSGEPQQISHV